MRALLPKTNCIPEGVDSWSEWQRSYPVDPMSVISMADIGGTVGVRAFSSNYLDPGAAWAACTAFITTEPRVSTLATDNQQMVADAEQWNFSHQTWNGASNVAYPLRTKLFLRGGPRWVNTIILDSGGDPVQDIQLSLLYNAGTRGDAQGTVPVIKWTGLSVPIIELNLTFGITGLVILGLQLYNGTSYQMLELVIFLSDTGWQLGTEESDAEPYDPISDRGCSIFDDGMVVCDKPPKQPPKPKPMDSSKSIGKKVKVIWKTDL